MLPLEHDTAVAAQGWRARLDLTFAQQHGRTVLARRQHQGPLQVQRAFYPEPGGVCHVYILHPPGGVVGGDTLNIEVQVQSQAQALLTTPGAGKFYRSSGAKAELVQQLTVQAGGALEWLPQEVIVFDGARAATRTLIELEANADFIAWEILCLGRRASGAPFQQGSCVQDVEIRREGIPLCLERNVLSGNSRVLHAPWGMAGYSVSGSFIALVDDDTAVQVIRDANANSSEGAMFSVTQLDGVLLCRYLGHSAQQARQCFIRAWEIVRPVLLHRTAILPRIWNT